MIDEIKRRLRLPTPTFWKQLQRRCAATSVALGGLTVTVASLGSHLPAIVPTALGYLTAFFGGIAAVSMLAVDNPEAAAAPAPAAEPTPPEQQP